MKLLFLFVFLLPTVAATSVLFDSYIQSGTNFTVDQHSFIVRWSNKGIYINSDIKDFFLVQQPCETAFPYIICLNSTPPSSPDDLMRITVAKVKPLLEIQRKFSATETEAGEYITVDVTLTNRGLDDMQNIDYRDTYPKELKIFGRTLPGNTYQQTIEQLKGYASAQFRYSVRADPVVYRSTAYASYEVQGKRQEAYSHSILLRVNPRTIPLPFEIIAMTEHNPVELNKETLLHIVIKNNQADLLQLPFVQLELPEQLSIRTRDFKKQGIKYAAAGAVSGYSARHFIAGVIPAKEGSYEIRITAGGKVLGALEERELSVYLNPAITPLQRTPHIQYNASENMLGFFIRLENANTYTIFEDVRVGLESPVFQFTDTMFHEIKPGEKHDVFVRKLELDAALRNPLLQYTAMYTVGAVGYKDEDYVYLGEPKAAVYEARKEVLLEVPSTALKANNPPEIILEATISAPEEPIESTKGNVVVVGTYVEQSPFGSLKAFFERVIKRILA